MNSAVQIENLSFSYGDTPLLKGLDLTISNGKFVAIIGDNGAGKTTLFNLILGNLKQSSGNIRIFGDDIKTDNHFRDISYISQNSIDKYRHFPTTVSEVLAEHLKFLRKTKKAPKLLKEVGLNGLEKKRLDELSGGQLQRVGILLALIKDAKLILLDEPTTCVDKKFSIELYQILKRMALDGKTVVMITHQLHEVKKFIDLAFKITDGKCVKCRKEDF